MKRGKPMSFEITDRIQVAVEESQTITIEGIRTWIKDHYKATYSWNTIRRHLDILIKRGIVKEEIVSTKGRKASVIKLNV